MPSTKSVTSIDPTERDQSRAAELSQTGRSAAVVPDERDAVIKRLERAVAEERQNAATLRETVDGLRFKAEVLEKSYAKQLTDVRQQLAAAEETLAEHRARVTEFGSDHEETVRLLAEARAELVRVKLDCDQLRSQPARGNSLDRSPLTARGSAESSLAEGTINQLISNSDWLKNKTAAAENSHLDAKVSAEHDTPLEEMISPELVFTKGRDDDR